MNLARLALVAAALALGVLEWAVSPKDTPAILVTDIAAGWAFCAGGLINLGGTRARRMALLFEVVGFSWLLGALVPSLLDVYRGPLVHLLIAYPTGRVGGRLQRAVVVAAYLSGLFGQLPGVGTTAPLLLTIVAILITRTATRASGPEARGRAAAAVAAVAIAAVAVLLAVGTSVGALDPDTGRWAYALVLGATGIALAADLRWGGWARDTVARVIIELGDRDEPTTLRSLIADALGDRSLVIGYATGEAGTYVDDAGHSIALPDRLAPRSVTTLAVDGEEVGILIRAGEVETDEALVEGVAAAAQLAIANARLQRQARRTINDLATSRQRLLAAADEERSRIDQELEVGVGQRLAKAERLLTQQAETDEEDQVSRKLVDELRLVSDELRELTDGLGAGSRVTGGLGPAVARAREGFADPDRHRHPWGSLAPARRDDGVFRLLRGSRECCQARPCVPGQRSRWHGSPVTWSSRSWTTAAAVPTLPPGPAFADSPTGLRRSEGPWRSRPG